MLTRKDRTRELERWMSKSGVPWVISNLFHRNNFLMIYTEVCRTKFVLFLSQSYTEMCKQEEGEKLHIFGFLFAVEISEGLTSALHCCTFTADHN